MSRTTIIPNPDPMTMNAGQAGVWGNPAEPDHLNEPAHLPGPNLYDYSAGVLVGLPGSEADAVPGELHPARILRRTDVPNSYQVPHEATHRRYEPPFTVPVAQAAAGFTLLAPPRSGLHYLKVLSVFLTLDAAGTLKFVQGSMDGLSTADLSGAFSLGGAAAPPLQLQPADLSTPWFFSSPDQALGIFTAVGKAQGFVTLCFSPYEA